MRRLGAKRGEKRRAAGAQAGVEEGGAAGAAGAAEAVQAFEEVEEKAMAEAEEVIEVVEEAVAEDEQAAETQDCWSGLLVSRSSRRPRATCAHRITMRGHRSIGGAVKGAVCGEPHDLGHTHGR